MYRTPGDIAFGQAVLSVEISAGELAITNGQRARFVTDTLVHLRLPGAQAADELLVFFGELIGNIVILADVLVEIVETVFVASGSEVLRAHAVVLPVGAA